MSDRSFAPIEPKGKRVYGVLIVILIIGGGILQFNWMQKVRETGAADVMPQPLAEKLSQWMMAKMGIPREGGAAGEPGVEKIVCESCMGTGAALSAEGQKSMCPVCQGVGFRMIRRLDPADRICPHCAGMGRTELPGGGVGTCPRCDGRGLVRRPAESAPAGE